MALNKSFIHSFIISILVGFVAVYFIYYFRLAEMSASKLKVTRQLHGREEELEDQRQTLETVRQELRKLERSKREVSKRGIVHFKQNKTI